METDGETIELWALKDKTSRLFVFPYSKEQRDKLENARKAEEQGIPIEGEFEIDAKTGRPTSRSPLKTEIAVPDSNITKGG